MTVKFAIIFYFFIFHDLQVTFKQITWTVTHWLF